MFTQTPVYIVAAGEYLSPAAALSMPCLHLAYTLGEQGQLRRDGPDSQSPGGLLGFYDKGLTPPLSLDAGRLIRQIREECSRRRFSGVVLDAQGPAAEELVSSLSPLLDQWNIPYYVPIKLASLAPNACYLLPSTLYEGSFDDMLEQYCRRYPVHRLALDVVRQCRRFSMPARNHQGESLSAQEFFRLQREYEPVSFFSQELCARYFTYRQGQETYFVLYDDPSTVSSKLNRARRMGLGAAFVLYRDFGPLCRTFLAPSPDASL